MVLVGVAMIGTYAAVFFPALVGQTPARMGPTGCIVWTGLFFYLWWRLRGRRGWLGFLIGAAIGVVFIILAGVILGYHRAEQSHALTQDSKPAVAEPESVVPKLEKRAAEGDATAALAASDSVAEFPIGTPVVVVVGQFPPTRMPPADSGYSKPLVVHPGKRGVVVGQDRTRNDLVIVQWKEQYWQEWTEPPLEGYLDSSKFLMSQTGKWIRWRSFTSTINTANLVRPI
jgi:hypothetical protein